MEKQYDYHNYLQYELFEVLIPQMLYERTKEEQDGFFQLLLQENRKLIHDMYKTLCEDDGKPCLYQKSDFRAEQFERGGVNILQILPPSGDPEAKGVLRAYLLFTKKEDGSFLKKYFVVKKFDNDNVFIVHITPKMEGILGEELTGHIGDMEYEYWKLVRAYVTAMIKDRRTGEK